MKYKLVVFHRAQACEGCMEKTRACISLYGTSTQLVNSLLYDPKCQTKEAATFSQ